MKIYDLYLREMRSSSFISVPVKLAFVGADAECQGKKHEE
jgi:hypothetical protein